MKVLFELIGKSFFFCGPLSMSKGERPIELDLDMQDDGFLRCAAVNTKAEILKCSVPTLEIVRKIKNDLYRNETLIALGYDPDIHKGKFKDVIKTKPEVIEIETSPIEASTQVLAKQEDVLGDDDSEDDDEPIGEFSDLDVSDHSLRKLLKGANSSVVNKLEHASLSLVDKERLLKFEKEGKNRRVIISIIEKL